MIDFWYNQRVKGVVAPFSSIKWKPIIIRWRFEFLGEKKYNHINDPFFFLFISIFRWKTIPWLQHLISGPSPGLSHTILYKLPLLMLEAWCDSLGRLFSRAQFPMLKWIMAPFVKSAKGYSRYSSIGELSFVDIRAIYVQFVILTWNILKYEW